VGQFDRKFRTEEGVFHQPLLVSEYQSDWPFVRYQNICSASISFVTIQASDRQRVGRTGLQQQYRALHCMQSNGKHFVMFSLSASADQSTICIAISRQPCILNYL